MSRRVSKRDLIEGIRRQLDEHDASAVRRHRAVVAELAQAKARDERVQREYAHLDDIDSIRERFARSERIFVGAMSEINLSMQRNNDRLDEMGIEIRANTQAVLALLDRLDPDAG